MNVPPVPTVSVEQVPDSARPLDVREPDEWAAGHAPTAVHLPMGEVTSRLGDLPADEDPLYVVCRAGGRSAKVVQYLVAQGYPAINIAGGMQAWAASGRPVVAEGPAHPEII